jgi:glutathione S-transferase
MSLTLYYHPLASFCHKVLIALYERGIAFEKRFIDLANPDDQVALESVWPLRKFPVIHDAIRDRNVAETSIIIEYLDQHFDGAPPLIPADPGEALAVRLWDRIFDNHVQVPMNEIVFDRLFGRNDDVSRWRSALDIAYGMIERQLGAQRGWICGDAFSMADCAAAPALFYASTVQPFPESAARLHAYFERLVERPSVRQVLEDAAPYFPLYPYADAIPKRFR